MSYPLIFILVLQWLVIIILAIIVYALTRQVGILFGRIAPAGALSINYQLKVGDIAPEVEAKNFAGLGMTIGTANTFKRNTLLFFLSPECPICKSLLPAIFSATKSEKNTTDVLFISDGDQSEHKSFISQYHLNEKDYFVSELIGKTYAVGRLPYAVLINASGKIASLGLVNTREHIDSLFEAHELGVESLQMYLSQSRS
ncbi:hypothetical protein AwWohl_14020 [Gammaproteobacteria bacterium]|nr:hypothetical protein AwWohl_14020 [Gammaproteobacteria bacterium]